MTKKYRPTQKYFTSLHYLLLKNNEELEHCLEALQVEGSI